MDSANPEITIYSVPLMVRFHSPSSLFAPYFQVNLLSNPGRPNSPVAGERSDLEVARSAALAFWSCSKSKSNKIVRNLYITFIYIMDYK